MGCGERPGDDVRACFPFLEGGFLEGGSEQHAEGAVLSGQVLRVTGLLIASMLADDGQGRVAELDGGFGLGRLRHVVPFYFP